MSHAPRLKSTCRSLFLKLEAIKATQQYRKYFCKQKNKTEVRKRDRERKSVKECSFKLTYQFLRKQLTTRILLWLWKHTLRKQYMETDCARRTCIIKACRACHAFKEYMCEDWRSNETAPYLNYPLLNGKQNLCKEVFEKQKTES